MGMTQGEALKILKTGANVFLTGEPGSGKTHTINNFVSWLRSCGIEPSVTAATGIAATHVSGMTLHSWSGIGIANSLSQMDIDRIASKEYVARRIQKAKVLIIDEVSMLSASTLEAADAVAREVRRIDSPFGGLQVILVGDFFQLPPIVKRGQEAVFAFESDTWRTLNPIVCYLTEQFRQDDETFLDVLTAVRGGEVEEMHFERLMERQVKAENVPPDLPKLFSHNADVDRINALELAKLSGTIHTFTMVGTGKDTLVETLKRGCLSPETLQLKEGATVMFTKNSPQGKFVNGTLGTVVDFEVESRLPVVETVNGTLVTADPMEWKVEDQGKVRASISQVPLRLAYAMTVHKRKGMSMDSAVVDLSQAFEYGQGYVALSRVRRLDGLHLLGINERALRVHPQILDKDVDLRELSTTAVLTFEGLTEEDVEDMQKRMVEAQGGVWPNAKDSSGVSSTALPNRLAQTLSAVRDARDLAEAVTIRGLTASTIVKHLEELGETGALALEDFMSLLPSSSALNDIHKALLSNGGERLAPVFATLNREHSYETIRLARLAKNVSTD